jgi:hypothetical protein
MFAWGNQSCGRLGLQEKKMEKAVAGCYKGKFFPNSAVKELVFL